MVYSIKLLDGSEIPWIAYGNGTAAVDSPSVFAKLGGEALDAGFTHIDTAQGYGAEKQEAQTGKLISKAEYETGDHVYLTSKLSPLNNWQNAQPIDKLKKSVSDSVKKLSRVPDLFLIHNPYAVGDGSGSSDQLKAAWKVFEELKDEGKLKAIGVSNFRPQDLKAILSDCKHKPAVHQLEFHPYLLAHLKPVLDIHKEHGIVAASYGPLSPILRNKGGRLDAVLSEIAQRVKKDAPHGAKVDETSVLLLWCKAQDIVAVTTSGNLDRIKNLAAVDKLPSLTAEEVEKISSTGKQVHFRHYTEHMEKDFAVPSLPSK